MYMLISLIKKTLLIKLCFKFYKIPKILDSLSKFLNIKILYVYMYMCVCMC